MTKHRDEPGERDEELHDLLRQWDAPAVPDGLDERMLARYRRGHLAWWRRPIPVRVSLPFAASVLLAAAGAILAARSRPPASESASTPASPVVTAAAQAEPAPAPARTSLAGFRPMTEVTATVVTVSP
jgi:hypothetical protein